MKGDFPFPNHLENMKKYLLPSANARTPFMRNPAAALVARVRFAWPGGYELFAYTDDGAVLCNNCCKRDYYQIAVSTPGDGWYVEGYSSLAETDNRVDCDQCGRMLQDDWGAEASA